VDHSTILIVDDDPAINELLKDTFEAEGWESNSALTGEKALELFDKHLPDLVVLDIGLPGKDGFQVCREMTGRSNVPVIMLSARDETQDKVKCLEIGADDYVTKPFKTGELVARIKAVFRRYDRSLDSQVAPFSDGWLSVNFRSRQVKVNGQEVKLSRTEFLLLQELVFNAGKVLDDRSLLQKVWGPKYENEREYLYVYIGHLRAKLERDVQNPQYIIRVQATGYIFHQAN
jgi:DNA-binding response OmpR family regulator